MFMAMNQLLNGDALMHDMYEALSKGSENLPCRIAHDCDIFCIQEGDGETP